MTTIIDPAGTPSVIFKDPSVAMFGVTATGSDDTDAASVPVFSGNNVVSVTSENSAKGVILPAGAADGDYFEIHKLASDFKIYRPDGVLLISSPNAVTEIRKTPSAWRAW